MMRVRYHAFPERGFLGYVTIGEGTGDHGEYQIDYLGVTAVPVEDGGQIALGLTEIDSANTSTPSIYPADAGLRLTRDVDRALLLVVSGRSASSPGFATLQLGATTSDPVPLVSKRISNTLTTFVGLSYATLSDAGWSADFDDLYIDFQ